MPSRKSKNKIIHRDKQALERAQLTTAVTADLVASQNETRSILDQLRRTRKARGGTGKPLEVPGNLKDAAQGQGIIITDADLNANFDTARSNR